MTSAPANRQQLFAAVSELTRSGWHELGDDYGGTGGPRVLLEHLLGFAPGAADRPDALGWELKYYTERTHLTTLFHKSPDNSPEIIRYLVRKHGSRDSKGRLSFRHTVRPDLRTEAQLFKPHYDSGLLTVRPRAGNGPVPRWSEQALLGAAGAKLRRLLMVRGERQGEQVRYIRADAFTEFSLTDFIAEVLRGVIVIDFDAREQKPGSHGMRDHGTKFRIPPEQVCRLYMDKQRIR